MSEFAYQAAKLTAWALPALLLLCGAFAIVKGQPWVGAMFAGAGIAGLAWDFLFLPASVIEGQPKVLRPEVVVYEDAPLGFFAFHGLPVLGAVLLVVGIMLLLARSSA
jgi:hypothetical protein